MTPEPVVGGELVVADNAVRKFECKMLVKIATDHYILNR